MQLIDYTTYNQVRASLGVGPKELKDDALAEPIWGTQLFEAFEEVSSLVLTTYAALPDNEARDATETRFANLVNLFATYAVAMMVVDNAEVFGFEKVTDGRASVERPEGALERLRPLIQGSFARVKSKLLDVLILLEPTVVKPSTMPTLVSSAGIATDPVTG